MPKIELDHMAVDIELILISLVQGIALSILAATALPIITHQQYEYWPYLAAALVIVLFFWSQAIVHAVSIINWPIDLKHSFMYFLIMIVEVMAFSEMINPVHWFTANLIFFLLSALLYRIDLPLIKRREKDFKGSGNEALYQDILGDQQFALHYLMPSGITFMLIALLLLHYYPTVFITHHWHVALAGLQTVIGLAALVHSVRDFQYRAHLLGRLP